MGTFRWYVYFMRQIQISRSVWYLLMVNGSVSNSYGGSILNKHTAKAVCSAAARRTTSSLVPGNSSHSLFLIILREGKISLDHIELNHSKRQWNSCDALIYEGQKHHLSFLSCSSFITWKITYVTLCSFEKRLFFSICAIV